MDKHLQNARLTSSNKPHPKHIILLLIFFLLGHEATKTNKAVSGQAIIPFHQTPREDIGNGAVFRSFLEPCEVVTLQTQCTEEEYESNEDCLPQKRDNCDRSKQLFCLSGVCLPNCHPHKEAYDRVEGKCFRKVGSDCKSLNVSTTKKPTQFSLFPHYDEDKNGQDRSQPSQQQQLSTVTVPECEKNAVCEKGQCRCAKNFTYDHNFSKCMLVASYGSYCNETISCDRKSDIVCIENQCQCTPEMQYIHIKRKRCYILIGQVCSSGLQFCPDNSNCVRNKVTTEIFGDNSSSDVVLSSSFPPFLNENSSRERDKTYRLLRHLYEENRGRNDIGGRLDTEDEHFIGIWGDDEEKKEFVCKCDRGYGSTRDKRFCLGLHGARCNTLHRCNMERGLKCVDGVCLCERGNEQLFSEQFQTCITRVGVSCIDDGKGEREKDICPVGGSCKMGKCTCDKGLTPASSTLLNMTSIVYSCVKSHGTTCKYNDSNNDSASTASPLSPTFDLFEPPCNHEIGLECNTNEGKCLCKDSNSFYDVRMRWCRGFQTVERKIQVIHFTPTEDREYNFRRNSEGGRMNKVVVFSLNLGMLLVLNFL